MILWYIMCYCVQLSHYYFDMILTPLCYIIVYFVMLYNNELLASAGRELADGIGTPQPQKLSKLVFSSIA